MPPAAPTPTQPTYGFVIPLADEGPVQLESCLGFLRAAYPDAPVVVVSDGVADPGYDRACKRHRARYVQGDYLKRLECGGAWWARVLALGLEAGGRWIVKLDADARVCRPFRAEPSTGIAGTVENPGTDRENVQGGIQAIHATVARRILGSGICDDGALRGEWTFDPDEPTRRRWRAQAYFCSDAALMWMARHLGIPCGDWAEVASRWLPPAPANVDLRVAATHPHKLDALPRFRDAPLRVVTTCRGRLDHLRETLPRWLAEPGVSATVVDYGCPDGTLGWVRSAHPGVDVVEVRGDAAFPFNLARARNLGAAHAPGEWLCFWDADCLCEPGWADAIRSRLKAGRYLLADPIEWSQFGSVVVSAADFRAAGGYDELMTGWGAEDGDFYSRLRTVGVRPGTFPGRFARSIPHDDAARMAHYDEPDKKASQSVSDIYHHKKTRLMVAAGRLTTPEEDRRLRAEALRECGKPADLPAPPPLRVRFHPAHGETPAMPEPAPHVYGPVVVTATDREVATGIPTATATANASATATATAGPAGAPGISPAAAMAPPTPIPTGAASPMMTVSIKANDASLDWAVDIGHLVEHGLRSPARDRQPVARHHVGR